ncbi:MAG: VWA-like domain-containing protein [Mesosutterella sp.]|nr:VWA-like domain-containing protein [Mesosutterella sp.]
MQRASQETLEKARNAVLKARVSLAMRRPFLATALLELPVRVLGAGVPTACTDGYRIIVSAEFALTLTQPELRGLLAHELLHVVLQHSDRRGARNPRAWNIACDYAVNNLLADAGFSIPEGGLLPPRNLKNCSAEAIYDLLLSRRKTAGAGPGPAPLSSPDGPIEITPLAGRPENRDEEKDPAGVIPGPCAEAAADLVDSQSLPSTLARSEDDAEDASAKKIVARIRREFCQQAKSQGFFPGSEMEELKAGPKPSVNWRAHLARFLTETLKTDWRLFPPSKRFISQGLYLPSCGAPALGWIVFAIDTSGSMSDEEINQILSELQAFRETFPCRLTVLQADADIAGVSEFEAWDFPNPKEQWTIAGWGGTDFRPVFKWVRDKTAKEGEPPAALIYATDGYGTFPDAPGLPVIWLVTPNGAGRECFPEWGAWVQLQEPDR